MDAVAVAAEERARRDRPAGHVASPAMSAWMRDMVRRYYLNIRSLSPKE